jgi:hypothetical protein
MIDLGQARFFDAVWWVARLARRPCVQRLSAGAIHLRRNIALISNKGAGVFVQSSRASEFLRSFPVGGH